MGITMKCYGGAPGNRGASLFPEGRTYSPPVKQAVAALPLVRLVRSSRSAFQPLLQRGQAMPQADIACAVGCHVFPEHQNSCETTSQLPAKTCHRQLCRRYGYRFSGDTHFLFAKKKQKRREGENKWQSTIWKQKWSAGAMGVLLLPLPPI